jgi:hypothetical protein
MAVDDECGDGNDVAWFGPDGDGGGPLPIG